MKKVEEHIFDLLYYHDCVILPEFGGFVGIYKDSKFNEELNLFIPPSKQIKFNKHLKNDDGLLIHDIANNRKISYDTANKNVKQYINTLKSELIKNKRFEIKKIGVLYLDNKENLNFISEENNFSTYSFGLPIIKPQIIEKTKLKKETISKSEEIDTPIVPILDKKNSKKYNYWWVAASILLLVFYSAWIPMKTELLNDKSKFHYSDLNPFTFQKNRAYIKRNITPVKFKFLNIDYKPEKGINKINLDDSIYLWVNNTKLIPAKRESTFVYKKNKKEKNLDSFLKYHIIGGCFTKKENAETLIKKMQKAGFPAKIIDKHQGLYRVSIKSLDKRNKAKQEQKEIKSKTNLNSWILKK